MKRELEDTGFLLNSIWSKIVAWMLNEVNPVEMSKQPFKASEKEIVYLVSHSGLNCSRGGNEYEVFYSTEVKFIKL